MSWVFGPLKYRLVPYISPSLPEKPLKSLCCVKGRTPGRLHEAPQSPGGAPPLSWSPLRLFAQAVALKTAHSVWMFFSQARAAGYMFAFPPLSKATFTSGPAERKGSTVYESMQGRGGQRYFETKCPFGMCRQAKGCPGAFIYLLFFFFFGVLAFLTNQDVVQRVWLLNGVYLYPSVWVFSKCVGKYSRAKIKKKRMNA